MRYLIVLLGFLFACGTSAKKPIDNSSMNQARDKGAFYAERIADDIYKERCDKLTFKAHLSSTGYKQDLSALENNGKWKRDEEPCYPDNSKSEISFDGLVGVLHNIVANQDKAMFDRLVAYGTQHNWIMGEGMVELTNMYVLLPTVYRIQAKLALDDTQSLDDALSGFRGHLLASFVWLQDRISGKITVAEMEAVDQLYSVSPEDPMYSALYHRFTDGDQDATIDILLNSPVFPINELPLETGVFGWGSAPASVYYLVTLAIIEGK